MATNRQKRAKPALRLVSSQDTVTPPPAPPERWVACETLLVGSADTSIFFIFREGLVPQVIGGSTHGHLGLRVADDLVWRHPLAAHINLDNVLVLMPNPALRVTDVRPQPATANDVHIAPEDLARLQADIAAGRFDPATAAAIARSPEEEYLARQRGGVYPDGEV